MPWAPHKHNPFPSKPSLPARDLRVGFRGRKRQEAKVEIWIRDKCQCKACGEPVFPNSSHLDHIVPLSAGGTHDDGNLQTLCLRCSKAKTAREAGRRGGGG